MGTRRTARLLLTAVALLPLPASVIDHAQKAPAPLSASGTWVFDGLSAVATANVAADLAQATPAAHRVLALIDGSIVIDGAVAYCKSANFSCSWSTPTLTRRWAVHLDAATLAGTYPSQRFITLHELGHAVWALVFSSADRQAFADDVTRSLAGQPCRQSRSGGSCAAIGEMFADEFARWAGGFKVSMSVYETPALLDTSTFSGLIDGALAHQAAAV